jgi:hypothetical protein
MEIGTFTHNLIARHSGNIAHHQHCNVWQMNKLIAIGILIVFAFFIYVFPYTMINPGELVEGHLDIKEKCFSCHSPFGGIPNEKCISCHKLSDIGKDATGMLNKIAGKEIISFHQNIPNQKCSSCHTDHKGVKPEMKISSVDHNILPQELVNQCIRCHLKPADKLHQSITTSCNGCHNTKAWNSVVAFNHDLIQNSDKQNCVTCHTPPTDNLHKHLSTNCSICHKTDGWKSSVVFNHNMIQDMERNNCRICHHAPGDSYHPLFKENCDQCHSTTKWLPSSFDHSLHFELDEQHNAACNTCHPNNNLANYTCYGCHEHSQNKIREEHTEHGIPNFSDCVACHRSGNEHDIKRNDIPAEELKQNEKNYPRKLKKTQEKDKKQQNHENEHDDD